MNINTVPVQTLLDVADRFNEYSGKNISPDLLKKCLGHDEDIVQELVDNTWTDTCIRERIMEMISEKTIGLTWPMFGDSQEYKDNFYSKLNDFFDNIPNTP